MKNFLVFIIICGSLLSACKTTKTATTTTDTTSATPEKLQGTWELNYITTSRVPFKDLYPDKKPSITFNVAEGKINGNTGCNTFLGSLNVNANNLDFTDPLALSRMACPGAGETVFLDTLKAINSYSIDGKTLRLMTNGSETMRFEKK